MIDRSSDQSPRIYKETKRSGVQHYITLARKSSLAANVSCKLYTYNGFLWGSAGFPGFLLEVIASSVGI